MSTAAAFAAECGGIEDMAGNGSAPGAVTAGKLAAVAMDEKYQVLFDAIS